MKTIRLALDSKLLRSLELASTQAKMSQSLFIEQALREYLKRLHIKEQEEQERRAYEAQPQTQEELEWAEQGAQCLNELD